MSGSITDKEAYFELFVPVLADLPAIKSLNVTIGSRFSRYNPSGSSWNQKFAVEWRPVDDLLLRGPVAGVFRAPSVADLYAGAAGSAPQFIDPCLGYILDHALHRQGDGGWADPKEKVPADPGVPGSELRIAHQIYYNLSLGYNLAAYHTRLDVGVTSGAG